MFLSDLKENQSGVISSVDFDSAFSGRLGDMGFTVGERVVCVKKAVFSSPVLYNVKGANISLRTCDAKRIGVEV